MLMATSVNPHFPYEYGNPVWDYAMPAYFRGDLAYNKDTYFGGGPIAGDSVAFNLGKLAGLPGAIQLAPIAGMWIIGAFVLLREFSGREPSRRRLLAEGGAALAIIALFIPPLSGALSGTRPPAAHGLLGRYYEGLRPGSFPPHIVRVDAEIDFSNVAELGALPFPSTTIWTGWLQVARAGLYHFAVDADDTGWVTIDGQPVIADPGTVNRQHGEGSIYLKPGRHPIVVGERNLAGDAGIRLYWQPPEGEPQIVPDEALIPEPVNN
jgi:hypothetical protein